MDSVLAFVAENQKKPCAKCSDRRYGGNPLCYQHAQVEAARKREIAERAIATRRANYPNWGKPEQADQYLQWQQRAMSAVAMAVQKGALPSLASGEYACTDCGEVAAQYDHRDYARALDVEPVCRSCNLKRGSAAWPEPGRYQFKRLSHAEQSDAA